MSRQASAHPTRPLDNHHIATTLTSFFFYGSGDHPDLHSFPTRRSSDLTSFEMAVNALQESGADAVMVGRGARSEEHTSELQSRRDLVCRLLLEKKKKKATFLGWC